MPLPTPILDDRSYQQLRDELVRRIPVYNPEWTDHNPSDPGITLLELFAFLGENALYRFNQIPETTKLAFLRLLQIPLRPAVPAEAMLALSYANPPDAAAEPVRVDLGSEARAGDLPFETLDEVTVAPWRMVALARTAVPPPDPRADPEAFDFSQAATDALGIDLGEAAFYRTDRLPDDPTKPGAGAVDFGASVDRVLWLAVVGTPDDATELKLLQRFTEGQLSLNVGFVPDEEVRQDDIPLLDPCPGEAGAIGRFNACTPSVQDDLGPVPELVWEISTGELEPAAGKPRYRVLQVAADTTRGLTQQGVVRLTLPGDATRIGDFPLPDPDLVGTGDRPPALDGLDPTKEEVRFWIRAYHRDPSHAFGRVLWMGANATEVKQQRRAVAELLGTGTGQAGQVYRLKNRPVLEGTLVVEVEDATGSRWVRWHEVEGFEACGEDDHAYAVDLESGLVRFGNGVQGFAPQLGQRIRATEYRHGGDDAGNVGAKAINAIPALAAIKAENPLPARGGAPAEPIAAALERLPGELRRHDRAVTPSDFRELALATPGADLGRSEVIPLFDPRTRNTQAAGVVTVVVLPRVDRQHPDAPSPDRTTLREVCAFLDKRRLVTTELYVIPPTYVKIGVSAAVHVKPRYGPDAVRAWVERVIRQYLAPLPPYGPDGNGWPLGRRVFAPEIEAAVLQVEGVEFVDVGQVEVGRLSEDGISFVEGMVELAPHQLPELAQVSVVASGRRLPVGAGFAPPPTAGTVVPIPTLVDEC
jgi:hypothetical protein